MNKYHKQYEYTTCIDLEDLNKLGKEGWKLTTSVQLRSSVYHFLKRRIK